MIEEQDQQKKNMRPVRVAFRMTAAIGVGLALAAIWWEYSDKILQQFLPGFLGG